MRLPIYWSCSARRHHRHRWHWTALVCATFQQVVAALGGKP